MEGHCIGFGAQAADPCHFLVFRLTKIVTPQQPKGRNPLQQFEI